MPTFQLKVTDGKTATLDIEADSPDAAVADGINALAIFAFKNFPPPDNVSVAISDMNQNKIATVSFAFRVDWESRRPH